MINYYQVLGLSQTATPAEIKQTYRRLAKQYHPDTNQGSAEAEQKFKQVQQAYETLGNEDARHKYDQKLAGASTGSTGPAGQAAGSRTTRSSAASAGDKNFDPRDVQTQFERFFGFNPKSNDASIKKDDKKKNPLDTSAIFEQYFGPRKK
ncbi:J domain-containing protein [Paenibacillus wulumuqiensis]|uniref:J domain-containing protein n=1 Tax=Paenibacillus wulumuqiensis TaxID=1567107 RepID=UPI0006196EC5|nr:DnaJ domain-containing protein [Paenibacillus wulumuqiensis]